MRKRGGVLSIEFMYADRPATFSKTDAHELISAMDAAMKKLELRAEQAEARASANERALAVACAQKSSSILDDIPPSSTSRASGGGGGERSSGASRRA